MSSTSIYSSSKVLPYVYYCKERTSESFYIGYRHANTVPSTSDFGVHYFSSNSYVQKNFANFDFHIVAEFFDKRDALKFESDLIKETRCKNQINSRKHLQQTPRNKYVKSQPLKVIPTSYSVEDLFFFNMMNHFILNSSAIDDEFKMIHAMTAVS